MLFERCDSLIQTHGKYRNVSLYPAIQAARISMVDNRWDEKAGLRRHALSSQVIDALEAHEIRRPAMRKPSTAALRRTGKLQDRQLTVGLDLGDWSSFYCVLNGAGEVILEARVATNPEAMKKTFGKMARSRIALETGTHSPWVSRVLSELGHEAIVAHARNVRLIGEGRRKDDRLDAQALARLARIDPRLLSPIQHRSAQAQADLSVIRARYALVRTRTALVCAARGLTKSFGERIRGRNPKGFSLATSEALSPPLQIALAPLLSALAPITARIREYDAQIEKL